MARFRTGTRENTLSNVLVTFIHIYVCVHSHMHICIHTYSYEECVLKTY